MIQDEVFGTLEQQTVLRRGRALYDLLADNPDVTYYGRGVGTLRPDATGLALLDRLVALQGVSTIFEVPETERPALQNHLTEQGYSLTHYATWMGGAEVIAAANATLANRTLPADITTRVIDAASPPEDLAKLAEISLAAGVMPIAGSVMRGRLKPGVGAVAIDGTGRPVACAAAASYGHPDARGYDDLAWWGMLATDPSRTGEGLAQILGATVLHHMHDRCGFKRFFTGVQPGNASSEAVCKKAGLSLQASAILTCVDPGALSGGKLTK